MIVMMIYTSYQVKCLNKNLAIANRSRVSCINTNNNTMTLKSGLEVSSIEGGIGQKTVFVAIFARKKTEDYYSL